MFHRGEKGKKRWENLTGPTEPHRVPGVAAAPVAPVAAVGAPLVRKWGLLMLERGPGRANQGVQRDF